MQSTAPRMPTYRRAPRVHLRAKESFSRCVHRVMPSTRCQAVETGQKPATESLTVSRQNEYTQSQKKTTIDVTENNVSPIFYTPSNDLCRETALQTPTEAIQKSSSWRDMFQRVNLSGRAKGLIMLNIMTLIMSSNFVVVKDAEALMDPMTFSAFRFSVAALPFFPFLASIKPKKEVAFAGAELGVYSALGYLTQGLALQTTDASQISFLSALTVILVPIIVGLSGRGVSKMVWGSAATALTGVFLLCDTKLGVTLSTGDCLGLASAAFIAFHMVRAEYYSRIMTQKDRFMMIGLCMISTAVWSNVAMLSVHADAVPAMLHSFSTATPETVVSMARSLPLPAIFFTGIVSTDLVLLLEVFALKYVEATDAVIIYTVEPVLGALWAYILLGERWGSTGWIGAILILTSSIVTQFCGNREEQVPSS